MSIQLLAEDLRAYDKGHEFMLVTFQFPPGVVHLSCDHWFILLAVIYVIHLECFQQARDKQVHLGLTLEISTVRGCDVTMDPIMQCVHVYTRDQQPTGPDLAKQTSSKVRADRCTCKSKKLLKKRDIQHRVFRSRHR